MSLRWHRRSWRSSVLPDDMKDLKERLGKIIVAYNMDGDPVTAADLHAAGSMAALLKDALKPNMIQTLEHTPALVHGGPLPILHTAATVYRQRKWH